MTALSVWLAPYDAIVAPPAPGPAPSDLTQTGDPSCCTLWSFVGFPAISIPVGFAPNGLPLGLQMAAAPGTDDRLLAVAQWCEARLGFKGLV
jgi:amidase